MPKKTFFNIAPQKRTRIIQTALQKFSTHNYTAASLSQIVKEAGIAKGSMYQYFTDKRDLYMYLIDYANNMKFDFISEEAEPQDDFFDFYRELMRAGALFDLTHPLISRFLVNVTNQPVSLEASEGSQLLMDRLGEFIENLIRTAKEHHHIAEKVDPDMAVYMINHITMTFVIYLDSKYSLSLISRQENKEYPLPLPMETVENEVDKLVEFLGGGLRA
jgi:AcrR family transcriptional regulator